MNGQMMLYLDQRGNPFWAKTLKELREQVKGAVKKMYVDKKDGSTKHVGYVIGDHWLRAHIPYEGAA